MNQSTEINELATALNAVMGAVGYVQKAQQMSQGMRYRYAGEADIIAALRPSMVEHGLVHVLGSDAHSATFGRAANLSEGLSALGTIEPAASNLAWISRTAPAAILGGDSVEPPFPPTSARR